MANRDNTKRSSSRRSLLFYDLHAAAAIPAVFLFCLIFLFAIGCATRPVAVKPDDPLFGTWVNDQHEKPGSPFFARKVISPDGRELNYDFIADSEPSSA